MRPWPVPMLLALAAAVVLTACGGGAAAPDLAGEWELVDLVEGGTVRPAPPGVRATLTAGDGAISGTSFCNSYTGTYRQDGAALAVEGLGGTELGCAREVMAAESAYLAALGAVEGIATADGFLVLRGPRAELRFRPLAAVPPSDLVGTRWRLETLLDGELASSTSGEPAFLELTPGGRLTAGTGCRDLTGRWTLDGDVLHPADVTAPPGTCPPEVATQDRQVTEVLSGDVRVTVAGTSLTVTGPGRLGLVYRALG